MQLSSRLKNGLLYVVMAAIPLLFFVALEIALRIFNYGYDYREWVSPVKGMYMLNTQIAHKYFYGMKHVPRSDIDLFDIVKKPNTFRVFVLGESAAAGYPFLPNGSFSRYLQQRLSLEYPGLKIEVVNCAMTAINSYAMLDFMPGILREKPDLILIYAGNNEYYGALGVGSMESFGTSRTMVNLVIYLEQFRTFQLLRNLISKISGLFRKKQTRTGTLMARMARDQYIALGSKVYEEGLKQFKGNMADILEMAKKHNVPVILGTLACNLKDQYPFVSVNVKGQPCADSVFDRATSALTNEEFVKADSLFRYAKDLDALRFRAPTALNNEIFQLGREFDDHVVNVDSAFDALSPDHIVGDNLMTDHLHPTLRGYEIMGRLYYDEMEKSGFLPKSKPVDFTNRQQDSITVADFPFAGIDSVIGEYRIKVLKDDWPYIKPDDKVPISELLHPGNYVDSLAFELVQDKTDWVTVHNDVAEYYAMRGQYRPFIGVMNVLIGQYPYSTHYYDYTANVLLHAKLYNDAYYYLKKSIEIRPSAFSEKWLGNIDLWDKRVSAAKEHLLASLKYDGADAQVWYNLSGAYIDEKNYSQALQAINETLTLQPNFPGARELRAELLQTTK
ncbi:MAG: GDSL-type esterase/lipase family protein [Bacteroidetes bacterium]|nr:GDSL-type esterase/lipase family protein [Bacteroidota bacterium]